jgi:hypothetical protein
VATLDRCRNRSRKIIAGADRAELLRRVTRYESPLSYEPWIAKPDIDPKQLQLQLLRYEAGARAAE